MTPAASATCEHIPNLFGVIVSAAGAKEVGHPLAGMVSGCPMTTAHTGQCD